ncbi:MAG: DUF1643 domain-containing protein, partial [Nitrospira sp.]
HIGLENDSHINRAISESDIILVAWGSSNAYEARKEKGRSLLQGKSHPSRASYVGYASVYSV